MNNFPFSFSSPKTLAAVNHTVHICLVLIWPLRFFLRFGCLYTRMLLTTQLGDAKKKIRKTEIQIKITLSLPLVKSDLILSVLPKYIKWIKHNNTELSLIWPMVKTIYFSYKNSISPLFGFRSLLCSDLNTYTQWSMILSSISRPPKFGLPSVALTVKLLPSINTTLTSKLPPPKHRTKLMPLFYLFLFQLIYTIDLTKWFLVMFHILFFVRQSPEYTNCAAEFRVCWTRDFCKIHANHSFHLYIYKNQCLIRHTPM